MGYSFFLESPICYLKLFIGSRRLNNTRISSGDQAPGVSHPPTETPKDWQHPWLFQWPSRPGKSTKNRQKFWENSSIFWWVGDPACLGCTKNLKNVRFVGKVFGAENMCDFCIGSPGLRFYCIECWNVIVFLLSDILDCCHDYVQQHFQPCVRLTCYIFGIQITWYVQIMYTPRN